MRRHCRENQADASAEDGERGGTVGTRQSKHHRSRGEHAGGRLLRLARTHLDAWIKQENGSYTVIFLFVYQFSSLCMLSLLNCYPFRVNHHFGHTFSLIKNWAARMPIWNRCTPAPIYHRVRNTCNKYLCPKLTEYCVKNGGRDSHSIFYNQPPMPFLHGIFCDMYIDIFLWSTGIDATEASNWM